MRLTLAVILCLSTALTGCGQSAEEAALCDKKESLVTRSAIGLHDAANSTTSRAQREQTTADLEELKRVVNEIDARGIKCKK